MASPITMSWYSRMTNPSMRLVVVRIMTGKAYCSVVACLLDACGPRVLLGAAHVRFFSVLDAPMVLGLLDHLETERGDSPRLMPSGRGARRS